jgi:hypothetical protein
VASKISRISQTIKKTFSKTTSNYHSNYHPIIIFGSFWGVLKYAKISLSTLSPSISVSQSLEECDSRMPLGTAATGTWDSQGLAVAVSAWRVPAWTYWDCNGLPIGSMYGIFANIWGILMVNVTTYGIHGSYGIDLRVVYWANEHRVVDVGEIFTEDIP